MPDNVRYYETRRLERVETYVANAAGTWSLVRKYVFDYEYVTYASESNKKFLLLKKVTEHDGAGNALPSTSFGYTPQTGVSQYEGWTNHSTQKCPIPLVTRVDNGYGGAVEYAYSAYNWAGNGGSSSKRTRQWVVSTKTTNDGMGNSFVTTYNRTAPSPTGNHVAGFATKLTSSSYPVFRGFGIVEVVEPTGHKQEHRFFRGLDDGDGRSNVNVQSYDGLTSLLDEEQYKGTEFEVVFKKAAGESGTDPIERRWSEFETKANPSDHSPSGLSSGDKRDWHVYEVYLKKQETHRGSASSKTEFTYGTYGNTTNIKEYESASDANWTRHTKRVFHPLDNATGYIVGRVAQETLYGFDSDDPTSDGISQRNMQYIYDSNTAWNQTVTSPGRLTRGRRGVTRSGSTKYVDTAYEYDTYGNRTKETIYNEYAGSTAASSDPRSTTIAYDATYHTFPITVTNPVGQAESRTFDAAFGTPLTVTDINGHLTTLIYDGFGRLTSSVGPSAGSPSYLKESKYTYGTPQTTNRKDDHLPGCGDAYRRRRYRQVLAQALPHLRRTRPDRPGVLRYREGPACRQPPLRRERSARKRVGPPQGVLPRRQFRREGLAQGPRLQVLPHLRHSPPAGPGHPAGRRDHRAPLRRLVPLPGRSERPPEALGLRRPRPNDQGLRVHRLRSERSSLCGNQL